MLVLGVCASAARALDKKTSKTRMENKRLGHQAQGLSLGHWQQAAGWKKVQWIATSRLLEINDILTSFSFSVFVIWKMAPNSEKKGQRIVDIQKLNNLVIPNAYILPLESEIISNIQRYTNLAEFHAASFFYQWLLFPDHYYIFNEVIYQGQESFQMLIMCSINLEA